MKKVLVVAGVLLAGLLAISIANAQFGNIKVPGVGTISTDISQMEYDQCKNAIEKYRDNVDYNSKNMPGILNANKDFKFVKAMKDYNKSGDKYDKENMIWEAKYQFKNTCYATINCNKEKCSSFWCDQM